MKKIKLFDPVIGISEEREIIKTLRSGFWASGSGNGKVQKFERKISKYLGSDQCIAVNSGTAALNLALSLFDLKNKDVILPSMSFISTAHAIIENGGNPIFVEVEPETLCIDPSQIYKSITKKTAAIIPVHFGGNPCDMDEIKTIANHFKLKIIEDAAHALPSFYNNNKIGTLSDAVCFSFYATKTLTTGEGGMVTTNNSKIAEKIKIQRLHGISSDAWKRYGQNSDWYYEVVDLGYKYNTTDIQASIGIIQLEKLEWMRDERKKIAEKYKNAFAGRLNFINENNQNKSSWHLFVIKIGNRDELHQKLKEKGISTSVHFIPIHKHPYYKNRFSFNNEQFPVANIVFEQSLSLPIYPGLGELEVEYIIKYVLEYAEDINK